MAQDIARSAQKCEFCEVFHGYFTLGNVPQVYHRVSVRANLPYLLTTFHTPTGLPSANMRTKYTPFGICPGFWVILT